jgi:hypothetical protein
MHGYAYRSTTGFQSEALVPYGLRVKPACEVPASYTLPNDIRAMMEDQRVKQARLPVHERVYIGGEIQIHHLTRDGCQVYRLDRFDDYSQDEQAMYARMPPSPMSEDRDRRGAP